MNLKILNDIYLWIEKTCGDDMGGTQVGYHNGSFIAMDYIPKGENDWEIIDLGLVYNRVMEHINSEGYEKIYLYVCPDDAYVCIEDPKVLDKDDLECYEEEASGLMLGLD